MTTHHTSGAADLPEALRLADFLQGAFALDWTGEAAAELRRLHSENERLAALAAGQAVAQPVRTWCDGCSLENCGGCHIPSNAAAPAQAPSQPGGFDAGDMASAAAQGYRQGYEQRDAEVRGALV